MCASTLKDCLLYWGQTNILNQPRNCCVSGLEWGRNRTSDLLFVTWQPHGNRKLANKHNYHQSLGIQDGNLVYNFSTSTHPGSALDLSPDGLYSPALTNRTHKASRIQNCTCTHTSTSHKLSIFDVRVRHQNWPQNSPFQEFRMGMISSTSSLTPVVNTLLLDALITSCRFLTPVWVQFCIPSTMANQSPQNPPMNNME
jgi:hypothetical protein